MNCDSYVDIMSLPADKVLRKLPQRGNANLVTYFTFLLAIL